MVSNEPVKVAQIDTIKIALTAILLFENYARKDIVQDLIDLGYVNNNIQITLDGRFYLAHNNDNICAIPGCEEPLEAVCFCDQHHYFYFKKHLRGEELLEARTKPSTNLIKLIKIIMRYSGDDGLMIAEDTLDLVMEGIEQGFLELKTKSTITFTPKALKRPEFGEYPKADEIEWHNKVAKQAHRVRYGNYHQRLEESALRIFIHDLHLTS